MFRAIMASMLAMGLTACAPLGIPQGWDEQPSLFPTDVFIHRVATSHVVLYWNCVRTETGVLILEGVAHNPWWAQEVKFLTLEIVGVDGEGHVVSEASGEARDNFIGTNQMTRFRLELRMVGSEVGFDLFYEYRFQEPEMRAWLAAGPARAPRLVAYANRFVARDACSDTKHLAR